MNKKMEEIAKKTIADFEEKRISRKQAIKKTALIAVSAATMMMLLPSNKAQAASGPGGDPGGGWN